MTDGSDTPLPALRQELELVAGPPNLAGAPIRVIYDPVRHRYFSLGPDETALLDLWQPIPLEQFCAHAGNQLGRDVSPCEVAEIIFFLHANNLTEQPANGESRDYASQARAGHRSIWSHMVHSYLFVRIPLVRPHRFLQATLPLVAPFFTRLAGGMVVAMGTLGLYLVSHQWNEFVATFLHFLSLEGIAVYGLAIVLIKILHELGHAWTATRHGVRVTSMGIAFMVMMPLLYTDVTNAWRLKSRAKRLQIDAAGIVVEISLACIATCLWAFLPDGPARSAAFVTATTSWILSLAINLNPFMKFDGYYLLVDTSGIPNIQNRAFALARWKLREWLFDLGHPPPGGFRPRTARMLILYAWGTWVYRLFLFIGIALLVYYLFFKLLGVLLFAIEIIWFIALPIWREVAIWWQLRSEIMNRRRILLTAGIVATLIAVTFVPIRWSVTLPAIAQSGTDIALHAPRDAQIKSWHMTEGRNVARGEVLAVLETPQLAHDLARADHAVALLDLRLARIVGDARDLASRTTIVQERAARLEERAGYLRQIAELVIRAPAPGTLRDVDSRLHPAAWASQKQRLARLIGNRSAVVRAYANEDVLWRLEAGDEGLFIPDDPQRPAVTVTLADIARAGSDDLEIAYLASVHGGAIASERDDEGRIRPRKSQYELRLDLAPPAPVQIVRGVVRLPGRPEPLASSIWRQIMRVLVRETGV